jgi:hypothetical protein
LGDAHLLPLWPSRRTELSNAIAQRRSVPAAASPYHPEAWRQLPSAAGLNDIYITLVSSLSRGFSGIDKKIDKTHTTQNSPGLNLRPEFICIATKELELKRWIGPLHKEEVQRILGPLQMLLCSTIPKPRKPKEERLIQNFSYPWIPSALQPTLINACIDILLFPCTWGTAEICDSLITSLPAKAQIAIWDVESA